MYSAVCSGKPGWWSGRLSGAPSRGALRVFPSLTSGTPELESDVAKALVAAAIESELVVGTVDSGLAMALAAADVESDVLVGVLAVGCEVVSSRLCSIDSTVAAADVAAAAEVAACAAVTACCEGCLCMGAAEAPAPMEVANAPFTAVLSFT